MACSALLSVAKKFHSKCLNGQYSTDKGVDRFPVPEDLVNWNTPFPGYKPFEYTTSKILGTGNSSGPPDYADIEEDIGEYKFNGSDDVMGKFDPKTGLLNRTSFEGPYQFDKSTHRPINPRGRTGITGRGRLGRFGPNHAADPIVSRFKRDANGEICVDANGNNILEIVLIKRKDNGEWAIPGGMVETGDTVNETLAKEFGEEALAQLEMDPVTRAETEAKVKNLFSKAGGEPIYSGYVDDPRNTDNAWMETVVKNFHDSDGTSLALFNLRAGDDATKARWTEVNEDTKLYASHSDFLLKVLALHRKKKQ
jgi:ADP-ribose pyrophosphatase